MSRDEDPNAPTTANLFGVGAQGGAIIILSAQRRFTPEEAINLASWLVAIAGDKDDFDALYERGDRDMSADEKTIHALQLQLEQQGASIEELRIAVQQLNEARLRLAEQLAAASRERAT